VTETELEYWMRYWAFLSGLVGGGILGLLIGWTSCRCRGRSRHGDGSGEIETWDERRDRE
jgi:hypothetical protein